jgi:heptosyltransferase II
VIRGAGGSEDLVIRAPNHLGDVVMALGALRDSGADVVVVSSLVPLLDMAGIPGRILPFRREAGGWFETMEALRRGGYRRGVLLSGSFSAALLFRLAGIPCLRGLAADGRTWMMSDPVPVARFSGNHRVNNFRLLAGLPLLDPVRPHPLTPPPGVVEEWRERLAPTGETLVGLFPGSNAPARRWDPDRFAELARALVRQGARVVVLGSGAERSLTAAVAAGAPGVVDLGGRTDLPGLAAVLSLCGLFVTNDTGPMHLAAAVGTRTLTLWGSSDPSEVHPLGADDRRIQGPSIPCAPCKKNHCPRSGAGTLLPEARNECMHLIATGTVTAAALELLS